MELLLSPSRSSRLGLVWSDNIQSHFCIIQRLAQTGIQPITHGASLALGTWFSLGATGRQRINEALAKRSRIRAVGKVLYFGFGYESFLDLIISSQWGLNSAVLCSDLCEVRSEAMAARTLAALWKTLKFPLQYEPAHSQFLVLVQGRSGILAGTTFSRMAEMMLETRRHSKIGYSGEQNEMADSESPAEALNGLFKISKREVEALQFVAAGNVHSLRLFPTSFSTSRSTLSMRAIRLFLVVYLMDARSVLK